MEDRFIGKRLDGRYEITELIGVGGMAVVYKAYDNIDDRVVAIKILKEEFLANDEFRRRFKNESKAIAVLSHPNIVKVYDVSFGDVLQYIVMEYIDGITLKQYIEQQGIIGWKDAVHFTIQILRALNHAHEKGIVHRDIKPQNIILLPNGTIKVTDFGIARFSRSEQRTITDKAIGSVHYISPEQARGDFTDGKADIYSVGVLLYEMLTGRVPFQADSAVSVAIMQLQNEPKRPCEINSLIPKGLEEITLKAMQKEPRNRYRTAAEMLADIEVVLQNPGAIFNYEFFIDTTPTRHVELPEEEYYQEEEEEKPKVPIVPILAGIAAVFIIILGIAGVFIWQAFNNSGNTITCPDLVGKVYEEIKNDTVYDAYNIVVPADGGYVYNNDYANGVIFKQTPEAKSSIKEKTEIKVYISLGPKELVLPDYENMEYKTAYAEMVTQNGLKVVKYELPDENIQKGYVIKTIPPAGSTVRTGDQITVYVSTGGEVIYGDVPSVIGMTQDAAKKELEQKGFKVGDVKQVDDPNTPAGIVVSQEPAKGQEIMGSPINIGVSTGKAPQKEITITVPLPDEISRPVEFSVWIDGVKKNEYTANIDLSQKKTYDIKLTGRDEKINIMVKIDSVNYIEYYLDFAVGQPEHLGNHDISSLIPSQPTTTPVATEAPTQVQG
ncbi:MAG: Stk1 family PASTA domain-containing Ser/Thr kinase [Clostridia bacterium]|nr:Stk1 family PASTA domain-containing Ser/Thr kinase [Clostridia bacterium]